MSSSSPRPPGDPVSPEQSQTLGLDRREIPQRSTTWAAKAADILHRARLSPNQISVLSVLFALVGAIALVWKIGRASCRERVELSVVGVSGDEQEVRWNDRGGT